MSAFRFSKTEKATAIFNTSNDDLRKKLKFPEYYTSIKPVDNVDPVDPSGNQKVLVGVHRPSMETMVMVNVLG